MDRLFKIFKKIGGAQLWKLIRHRSNEESKNKKNNKNNNSSSNYLVFGLWPQTKRRSGGLVNGPDEESTALGQSYNP